MKATNYTPPQPQRRSKSIMDYHNHAHIMIALNRAIDALEENLEVFMANLERKQGKAQKYYEKEYHKASEAVIALKDAKDKIGSTSWLNR